MLNCTIHILKSGTLCLQLCVPATVPTLSAGTSRLITSSKPFHTSSYLPPCTSDSAFADNLHVYKFHLLTYWHSDGFKKQNFTYKAKPETILVQVQVLVNFNFSSMSSWLQRGSKTWVPRQHWSQTNLYRSWSSIHRRGCSFHCELIYR